MLKIVLMTSTFLGALVFIVSSILAEVQVDTQDRALARMQEKAQKPEQIYGRQLMTRRERNEYRSRILNARTAEDRKQIRQQHHERMRARAAERGLSIPEEALARGAA